MYKSVSIRDSRLSLELNASLWRLSWITFIFLPLTFLASFFGMNVDLFQNRPSTKWYFISAATLVNLHKSIFLPFSRQPNLEGVSTDQVRRLKDDSCPPQLAWISRIPVTKIAAQTEEDFSANQRDLGWSI